MLGLYLHIPFCLKKCDYCDFCSFPADEVLRERYVGALLKEIRLAAATVRGKSVDTVFIGGGTPTVLSPQQLGEIFQALREEYTLSEGAEISIESNPATLTAEHLALFRAFGVTRISIGLQAAQNSLLKRIGRAHTWEEFLETYHSVRKAGPWAINIDLIYHLPGQTLKAWRETLNHVAALKPEHISCYSLQLEEGTPLTAAVAAGRYRLSSDTMDRKMHHEAMDFLAEQGYLQYEISNFALPGHQCRHNLGYWKRTPYLGLGLGAHGFDGHRRLANPDSMEDYLERLELGELPGRVVEEISPAEARFEAVMLGLRMNVGVDWPALMKPAPEGERGPWERVKAECVAQGLLEQAGPSVRLTRKGMDLSNSVFSAFMQL